MEAADCKILVYVKSCTGQELLSISKDILVGYKQISSQSFLQV